MNNQFTPCLSNVFDHLFNNKEKYKKVWERHVIPPEQLSGVYLFECDKGSHYDDFVVSYVLDHLFLNKNQSRNVAIISYEESQGAQDIYNLINDYSMNGFIDVDMRHISIVYNGLGIHNDVNGSTIFIGITPNNIEQIDLIVLDSENMAWSLINKNIVEVATGILKSVTFFNNGMIMEDKRNPLFNMKSQNNIRYEPICALDFDRNTVKRFISNNSLNDSIKIYPCAVKELLVSNV